MAKERDRERKYKRKLTSCCTAQHKHAHEREPIHFVILLFLTCSLRSFKHLPEYDFTILLKWASSWKFSSEWAAIWTSETPKQKENWTRRSESKWVYVRKSHSFPLSFNGCRTKRQIQIYIQIYSHTVKGEKNRKWDAIKWAPKWRNTVCLGSAQVIPSKRTKKHLTLTHTKEMNGI